MEKFHVFLFGFIVLLELIACAVGRSDFLERKDRADDVNFATSGSSSYKNVSMWALALLFSAGLSAVLQVMLYLPQFVKAGIDLIYGKA